MKKLLPVLIASAVTFQVHAQALPDEPHMQVNGVGEVWATPDQVTINVSVNEQSMDVMQAKQVADGKLAKMIALLKEQGVAAKDIHASQLNIHSKTRYNRDSQRNEFDGYEVSRSVNVILRSVDKYANVLQALVQTGANQVGQSQFGLSNYDELYAKARQLAFKDAKENASVYAQGFEAKVGKVYSINAIQHQQPTPYPRVEMKMMASDAARSVQDAYNVGEIKVSATVNAVFLLDN
ncbi:SIMPL domain-containing protein [Pseudoalteromonas sp. YIC-656]|uniref:SIMPL domain-containing protein n=1 Tax=Pseudoalteromonas pernae TaxID=3118054 RepID=UPI0032427E64